MQYTGGFHNIADTVDGYGWLENYTLSHTVHAVLIRQVPSAKSKQYSATDLICGAKLIVILLAHWTTLLLGVYVAGKEEEDCEEDNQSGKGISMAN